MNLTKRCSLRRCSMIWFQNKATRLSGIKSDLDQEASHSGTDALSQYASFTMLCHSLLEMFSFVLFFLLHFYSYVFSYCINCSRNGKKSCFYFSNPSGLLFFQKKDLFACTFLSIFQYLLGSLRISFPK